MAPRSKSHAQASAHAHASASADPEAGAAAVAERPEEEPPAAPSLEDLVPVEPGDTELGLTDLLRACLQRRGGPLSDLNTPPPTWKHRLIAGLLLRADKGDLKAMQEIWNRVEGKAGGSADGADDDPDLADDIAVRILYLAGPDVEAAGRIKVKLKDKNQGQGQGQDQDKDGDDSGDDEQDDTD